MLVGKLKGRDHSGDLDVGVRVHVAQDSGRLRAAVNSEMNPWVS